VRESMYGGVLDAVNDYGRLLLLLGALVVLLWEYATGSTSMTSVGDAYFLLAMYSRLVPSAANLLDRYDTMKRSEATSQTYLEVLQGAHIQAGTSPTLVAPEHTTGRGPEIEFRNVSFSYPGKSVLTSLTFKMPAGKTTLLLGPSGCGKTTIARLLL